jgi:murein DD-endopeptidase MepM/ murein hydrolase activator NlpD
LWANWARLTDIETWNITRKLVQSILRICLKAAKPLVSLLLVIGAVFLISSQYDALHEFDNQGDEALADMAAVMAPLVNEYGIDESRYTSTSDQIRTGETFSGILERYGVGTSNLDQIVQASKDVIDIRRIAAGREITAYQTLDSLGRVDYLVYEPNALEYVVFDFTKGVNISRHDRQVTLRTKRIAGAIEGSLYGTLNKLDLSASFGEKLTDLFAHKIDFYRIRKGDNFKVIFEEKYVGDTFVGYGNIKAAVFYHGDNEPFYAFAFNQDGKMEYYDQEAKSLKSAFLKAPLKFTRISSPFSNRRFHPVLKSYRAHLGTDYAAPTGTPIYAIADGIVENSGYTSGNGNYVKIRHNRTYDSGYLHMSRIASGMRPGAKVSKGQVIGYVGSTGLATGPHLCFRFWKNGTQIDFLKEQLPSADAIDARYLREFTIIRDMWKSMIDNMKDTDLNSQSDESVVVATI